MKTILFISAVLSLSGGKHENQPVAATRPAEMQSSGDKPDRKKFCEAVMRECTDQCIDGHLNDHKNKKEADAKFMACAYSCKAAYERCVSK